MTAHSGISEPGVSHSLDPEGVVRVVFDLPGDRVNLVTPTLLETLDRLLDDSRADDRVKGMLFESAKPGMFLAGLDVEAIAALKDAYYASEASRRGQAVLQKLADAPWPTACAINGVCLGAGTEIALACRLRIASDDRSVRIGVPEVRLGIVPGFGGTQRLPRRVGLVHAIDLIVSGRQVDAWYAARIGLVDRVVPATHLRRETVAALREAADVGAGPAPRRPLGSRIAELLPPLRARIVARARSRTETRVAPRDYPAPFRALDAVEAAFSRPLSEGLDLESRIVGELVPTRTSKNLIWLFRSQDALKREAGGYRATPRRVRKVGVLGAGVMGAGIAQLVADREFPVRLRDVSVDALLRGLRAARKIWTETSARAGIGPRETASRMAFIAPAIVPDGIGRADLVIEAVVEDLAVKQQVLAEVEERVGERAVFATNTSTLPVSEIAARAMHPERVVGMHFFNPVHRMPLVEVVAGQRTSPEAVVTVHSFALELGKTPVVVRDAPGFLVNRILMLYLGEATRLLAEGLRIEAVDSAMREFGMPVGPFEMLDDVGLDTARHAAEVMEASFGKRIGGATALLAPLVDGGRLGAKNGSGFYRYRDGRRTRPDGRVYRLLGVAPRKETLPPETLQERMVLSMVNEAAVCLEDGVAREPRDVDVALVLGAGFPAFRGGPLRYADGVGVGTLVDRLSRLADGQGERFRPAGLLRDLLREARPFYPE